ncbi:MAG: MFS transporter [Pseudomonadota bacterium]
MRDKWHDLAMQIDDATNRRTMSYINVGHSFSHLVMLLYPTVVLALEPIWQIGFSELLPLGFAGYLLFGLGALPAGWLGDRWDSGWLMVIFFLGTGIACILAGLASGPYLMAMALTLIGLFASIYHPVALAWVVGASKRPGRALGINGVYGAIGTASAALLAGFLADVIHWRSAFILPGIACLLYGISFMIELMRGRVRMVRGPFRAMQPDQEHSGMVRGLVLMLAAILFTGMIFQMNAVGLPKIFQVRLGDDIGFGAMTAGALVSVVYLVSTAGQLIGGHLADHFDERRLYVMSYSLQIGLVMIAAMSDSFLLVLLVALAVSVQTGTQPIENCLMARYTPATWRATIYGLKFVVALGMSALGVPLIAYIFATTGEFTAVFWSMAMFSAIAVIIALLLPTDRRLSETTLANTPVTSS